MDELLSVAETYDTPSPAPTGITWDGNNIWSCDSLGRLYKHNMDASLSVASMYDIASNAAGIVVDQKYAWSAHADSNKIYKYSRQKDFKLIAIYLPSVYIESEYSLSGISWDGSSFWTVSEGAHRIFQHNLFRTKMKRLVGD